jgi:putative membrane protein
MKTLIHLFLSTVAVFVSAYVIPTVSVANVWTAFVVAIVLGILNMFLRPILIFLTLPISVVTLGLFVLVINTVMIMIAAAIVPGFDVGSFWAAFLFGVVLFLVSSFMQMIA